MYQWDIALNEICSTYKKIKENISENKGNNDLIAIYRDQLIAEINKELKEFKNIQKSVKMVDDDIEKQEKIFERLIKCRVTYECAILCLHYMNRTVIDSNFDVEMNKIYNTTMKKEYIEKFKRMGVD